MQSTNGSSQNPQEKIEDNQHGTNRLSSRRQNDLPPEIVGLIWSALQVGSLTGMSGALVGGFAGVLRSTSPVLFALASGIQWFTLGTTFWASRGFLLHNWSQNGLATQDKIIASAMAGGISGFAGGILRGRRNIIPGTIMFALFGAAGQTILNSPDAQRQVQVSEDVSTKTSWLNSKWSPMKSLSDEEYEAMLRERLLRVNAEIALLDESISKVKAEESDHIRSPRE